ncbi:sulfurtransferase complex subunit TusD [Mergibacter septicus]|uniref:Sulfurtransferase complex subunit TusD n=1 Tax=Mergibacter septicus TaxID=221402 RepID=A0A8E3MBT9_9PAST|nr:sulfurtransferase complex subunit TusD [Mergibacter septicus]AWX14469.1 sulfurtransferase complex subunit TusD [Mergibacter septicus]AWX14945.1 sulfurtransferase complex subunit TusD [Mergibacter septicus]QDJ12386.1 sulfurtransferase complex subunit TusD [Mergibacter septicus]QDJ14197.1 sulfurtransferase complex subunit TusD [Mergibacter septicus]UTU48356.1 sulfurtransferase complex subunit TusD [Mergibacter septicus]
MRYVLSITQPVYGSQASFLAYQIAQALLAKGHTITQIFFSQAGVTHGNQFVYPANDEFNLVKAWQQLAKRHNIPLSLCIAAAQRRGIVNPETSANHQQNNLADGFVLTGLGEFSQAVLLADRVITL